MKKIYLTFLGLAILLPCQTKAIDCAPKPNTTCTSYGYIHNGCPGNFVSCPFDTNFKTCDEEAYKDDFKFAIGNVNSFWTKANNASNSANNDYSALFIVGAQKNNYSLTKCATYVNTINTTSTYKSHTHNGVTVAKGSAYLGKRRNAGGGGYKAYCQKEYDGSVYDKPLYTSTTGIGGNDSETAPVNYAVDGYFYTYTPFVWNEKQAALSQTLQKCSFFGYNDTISDCPGDYVVCPFDKTAVMCDMEAQAGEIKFSLQTDDHDGWLLCNGRSLGNASLAKYNNSELADILRSAGFTGTFNYAVLPNYQGMFLRLKGKSRSLGIYSSSNYKTAQPDRLKTHSHTYYDGNIIKKQCDQNKGKGGDFEYVNSPNMAEGGTIYFETTGSESRPPNYSANIFIYTGKLNVD